MENPQMFQTTNLFTIEFVWQMLLFPFETYGACGYTAGHIEGKHFLWSFPMGIGSLASKKVQQKAPVNLEIKCSHACFLFSHNVNVHIPSRHIYIYIYT